MVTQLLGRFFMSRDETPEIDPVAELIARYRGGERRFLGARLGGMVIPERTDLRGIDLSRADLIAATLAAVRFVDATLLKTYLVAARMREADLSGARAPGAVFTAADLRYANLTGCDASHADFGSVDLTQATIARASFADANLFDARFVRPRFESDLPTFDGARLGHTVFVGMNLAPVCRAKGVRHVAPSSVDGLLDRLRGEELRYGKVMSCVEISSAFAIASTHPTGMRFHVRVHPNHERVDHLASRLPPVFFGRGADAPLSAPRRRRQTADDRDVPPHREVVAHPSTRSARAAQRSRGVVESVFCVNGVVNAALGRDF